MPVMRCPPQFTSLFTAWEVVSNLDAGDLVKIAVLDKYPPSMLDAASPAWKAGVRQTTHPRADHPVRSQREKRLFPLLLTLALALSSRHHSTAAA